MIPVETLRLKIATLESLMSERSPGYKTELEQIRITLQRDPEILHLLDPEKDLQPIFLAMQRWQDVEIPVAAAKKESNKILPKGRSVTVDDF